MDFLYAMYLHHSNISLFTATDAFASG